MRKLGTEKGIDSDNQTLRLYAKSSMLMPLVLLLILSVSLNCLPQNRGKMSLEEFNREVKLIQDSIKKQHQRNTETYSLISNVESKQGSSTEIMEIKEKALTLKSRTDEVMAYTHDVMIHIIQYTENNNNIFLERREINFAALRRIDITYIPHEILIGNKNDPGKAKYLRLMLEDYKQYLSNIIKDDPSAFEKLDKHIDIRQTIVDDSKNQITWENYYFAKKSEGEALIKILSIQASVKHAESLLISYLYNTLL